MRNTRGLLRISLRGLILVAWLLLFGIRQGRSALTLCAGSNDDTTLRLAVVDNDLGQVKILLGESGHYFASRPSRKIPLLVEACGVSDYAIVKLLLDNGADPNSVDQKGWTALFSALPRPRILQLLLSSGADAKKCAPEQVLGARYTALHLLSEDRYFNYRERVVSVDKADVDLGVESQDAYILVKSGLNVNLTDGSGNTALMYACKRGAKDLVRTLLLLKADAQKVNRGGESALTLSKNYTGPDYLEIAALLRASTPKPLRRS